MNSLDNSLEYPADEPLAPTTPLQMGRFAKYAPSTPQRRQGWETPRSPVRCAHTTASTPESYQAAQLTDFSRWHGPMPLPHKLRFEDDVISISSDEESDYELGCAPRAVVNAKTYFDYPESANPNSLSSVESLEGYEEDIPVSKVVSPGRKGMVWCTPELHDDNSTSATLPWKDDGACGHNGTQSSGRSSRNPSSPIDRSQQPSTAMIGTPPATELDDEVVELPPAGPSRRVAIAPFNTNAAVYIIGDGRGHSFVADNNAIIHLDSRQSWEDMDTTIYVQGDGKGRFERIPFGWTLTNGGNGPTCAYNANGTVRQSSV